ncbi:MAG: hypothetical protein ACI9OU_000009 [Candidatus Promineifilaceae bacterium]|jgi:hypothetical protein
MKAWTLSSCLAPQIETFIKLRQLSGTDYHSQARLLGYFDRFLVEQGLHPPCIKFQGTGHQGKNSKGQAIRKRF